MVLPIDIVNYILIVITVGTGITWAWLLRSVLESRTKTPRLEKFEKKNSKTPTVSIILPARNEEHYIKRCLDSLIDQDYSDYEIIAIDDSSEDNTGSIIANYAKNCSKIVHVSADPKPDGWTGKNWACMQGYKEASGDLLLFTDSDTHHAQNVISLAVGHLLSQKLDALTVIPKMICMDFWTRVTLPVISTFLHSRFSALRVNDSSKKTGYFFGSFFIIKRATYDSVGTHSGVRQEIIEDGALGRKVKESGYNVRMVLGDDLVEAVWARGLLTLWHALGRLMVPLYLQDKGTAVGVFFAVLFLLFMPFVLLAYSIILFDMSGSFQILFAASLAASAAVYTGAIIETGMLHIKQRYALAGPAGGLIVVLGFCAGLMRVRSSSAVRWRGRTYSTSDYNSQNPIRVQ